MNWNRSPLGTQLASCLACLLLPALPCFAQDDEEGDGFGRRGWYLAADVIGAFSNYRDTPGDVDDRVGFDLRAGYRVNSIAALEAEFEWVSPFEETNANGSTIAEYRSYAIGVNGKLFVREAALQPYVIVGVNALIVSESAGGTTSRDSDWGFRGGAGADYYVSPHVALNVEVTYMWGVGDVWQRDYTAVGAGLMYRF